MRTPEGGPKDFTPPKMISSDPPLNSVNFDGKRVILTFDEFIQLKDMQQSFVVSPPSKKRLIPKLRGNNKEILIEFEEDLWPNTTYSLSFGNSVVDLHEGNPLPNFGFAFSTGNVIDSLSITGKVIDALTHKPSKESLYVMLYRMYDDTIPRKTLPLFVTKTNPQGWFTIPHIYADTFMIFALKDANMNFMFDQSGEQIAFSDTTIVLNQAYYQLPDTSFKSVVFSDSVTIDSIDLFAGKKPQIELYYFKEEHGKQKFLDYTRTQQNQFTLNFEMPVNKDSLGIELLNPKVSNTHWFLKDNILMNDTLEYWIADTALYKKDTLAVRLSYAATDSLDKPYIQSDTIKLIFKQPTVKAKRAALARSVPKMAITSSSSRKSEVDLNDKLYLETSLPAQSFDKNKMQLFMKEDTLQVPVKFDITRDSIYLRRFNLSFPLDPNREYKFICDTIAFTSIFGQNNDSTDAQFKTRNDDYYGTINLTLKNTKGPVIVQLLSERGEVVKLKYASADGSIKYDFLAPGKYGLKVIYDSNNNKLWDTGNWGLRKQPEKSEFYQGEISVRSNWDVELNWELKGK